MVITATQFAISVLSHDRVGIVAAVASQISALHGDIADLRQSVLAGYFSMILLASFPGEVRAAKIEASLAELCVGDGPPLRIAVLPVVPDAADAQPVAPANVYVLTASGRDRIGFVATLTAFCAEEQINILDLATVAREGQYTMMLQVDLSRCSSLSTLQQQLRAFGQQHSMQIALQHNDIFEATHEITMPGRA